MNRSSWMPAVLAMSFWACVGTADAAVPYPAQPRDTTSIERMRSGTLSANNQKARDSLEDLAKWLAYRVAHPPFNGDVPAKKIPGPVESLETLIEELDRKINWPNPKQPPNELQMEYAKEFGKVLDFELMFVINETVKKIEKVNAARLLARAGKLPYEGFADSYLKIIKEDKYGPELKLFAFKGLRNLLAIPYPNQPGRHFIQPPEKLAEICKALETVILRSYAKEASPVSAEQAQVIQFIRREAVRAMAQFKNSVVRSNNGQILAKPIWTLLRAATNDRVVSPDKAVLPGYGFHMLERIDAVIGISNMLPDKAVNLDAVAYLVNEMFVEMGVWHETEKAQLLNDPRHKPIVPWRITASRLIEALETWKAHTAAANMRNAPGAASVAKFADVAIPKFLSKIESAGLAAVPDNRPFTDWRQAHKPTSNQVVADDPETAFGVQ